MSKHWYFQVMGEAIGPITSAELKHRAEHGQIQAETLVRLGEDGKWRMAASVKGLLAAAATPAAAATTSHTESIPAGNATTLTTPELDPHMPARTPGVPERTYHLQGQADSISDGEEDDSGEYDFFKFVGFELALGPALHQAFLDHCRRNQLTLTEGTRQAVAKFTGREDLLKAATEGAGDAPASGSQETPSEDAEPVLPS